MAIINPLNNGTVIGRLPKDPKIFDNKKDGSKSVRFTVMARNGYKNAQGGYDSTAVDLEAFIPATAEGNGVYDILKKGILVQVTYEIRRNTWPDKKTGEMHYDQVLRVNDVRVLESKATTDARAAKDEAADAAVAEVAEVAEVETVSIDELI